ncbi:MAG TPA: class I SAM-dependent methyltransferase, partial [Acidimicrobiales bacterium]|nr:class I SAM-dependent methyltransferase [Acidimicrobiales bacterium]
LAAKRLPTGHAVGLDRWTADQSGNRPAATHRNLEVEAVAGRCHLVTGDMLALPFADGTFDLALSGLAVHNVGRRPSRPGSNPLRALDEVVRVLAPGGRMAIVDLFGVPSYARHLAELGMAEVSERALGWRVRFAPGVAARLVTARKP